MTLLLNGTHHESGVVARLHSGTTSRLFWQVSRSTDDVFVINGLLALRQALMLRSVAEFPHDHSCSNLQPLSRVAHMRFILIDSKAGGRGPCP